MSALIQIVPALTCQYLASCDRQANKALIWSNDILPIRWSMMPVCDHCLSAALVLYAPKPIVPTFPNYVNEKADVKQTIQPDR